MEMSLLGKYLRSRRGVEATPAMITGGMQPSRIRRDMGRRDVRSKDERLGEHQGPNISHHCPAKSGGWPNGLRKPSWAAMRIRMRTAIRWADVLD
ncbi:MAG: hypothetical protein AB1429_02230 [Pseudomonadota bacterium]